MGLAVEVGWILGLTLIDGDSLGIKDGSTDILGAPDNDGASDGFMLGSNDSEGASLGSELGSCDARLASVQTCPPFSLSLCRGISNKSVLLMKCQQYK